MSRLSRIIEKRQIAKQKVFVAYLTAGDPKLSDTPGFVAALARGGADIIELGIPFSDPLADGPTNQKAAERALEGGASLRKILALVPEIRKAAPEVGIVVFSYLNPIFSMGFEAFAEEAARVGVDGVLIVDLPPEEAGDYRPALQAKGLDTIFLASPTSDAQRLALVDQVSTGFVYYVSTLGVTGARARLSETLSAELDRADTAIRAPLMVGFGISSPQQAADAARLAAGVVIGSAIVKIIEEQQRAAEKEKRLEAFAFSIRSALDGI